jgi:hypothetical protein
VTSKRYKGSASAELFGVIQPIIIKNHSKSKIGGIISKVIGLRLFI